MNIKWYNFLPAARRPILWFWVTIGLIFIHICTVNYYSVNVPYMDDFTFLVDVIHWKKGDKSWQKLLNILLTPHGPHMEHLLLFGRLTAIFDYLAEGQLNFKTMIWVGNALLITTFLLLVHMARRAGLSWFQIVPVTLLLFQPQYYEVTMTWAICAVQHVPSVFFAFLSFYFLTRSSALVFGLSFPTAFLSFLSNGNGFAVLITGVILLLMGENRRRLYLWVSFATLAILLSRYLASVYGTTTDLTNLAHPLRILGGFFVVSGSIGVLFTRSLISLSILGLLMQWLVGTVAVVLVLNLLKTKYTNLSSQRSQSWAGLFTWFKKIPVPYQIRHSVSEVLPLLACYLYVFVTLAGIAFARSTGWAYGLLVPRFIWFDTLLVATGYLLTLVAIRPVYRISIGKLALLTGLGFYYFSYWYTLDEVMNQHKSLVSDMHNWRENELIISLPPDRQLYDRYYSLIIKEALTLDVYALPIADFDSCITQKNIVTKLIQEKSLSIYGQRQHLKLLLSSHLFPATLPGMSNAYLLLRSAEHMFVWPVDQSPLKLAHYLIHGKPDPHGSVVTLYSDLLPASAYRLGLLYRQKHGWRLVYSPESIVIDHRR